jgi:hypothetical protein
MAIFRNLVTILGSRLTCLVMWSASFSIWYIDIHDQTELSLQAISCHKSELWPYRYTWPNWTQLASYCQGQNSSQSRNNLLRWTIGKIIILRGHSYYEVPLHVVAGSKMSLLWSSYWQTRYEAFYAEGSRRISMSSSEPLKRLDKNYGTYYIVRQSEYLWKINYISTYPVEN